MNAIDISNIIKAHLQDKNITQKEFAKKLGVSRSLVSSWVKGDKQPSLDNLQKIFDELCLVVSNQEETKNSSTEKEELFLLNKIIKSKNISTKELSNLLSLDYEAVRRKLKGTRRLHNHELVAICDYVLRV